MESRRGRSRAAGVSQRERGKREREIEAKRERLQALLHPVDQFTTP